MEVLREPLRKLQNRGIRELVVFTQRLMPDYQIDRNNLQGLVDWARISGQVDKDWWRWVNVSPADFREEARNKLMEAQDEGLRRLFERRVT
jgi:hypothetical protein